MLRFLYSPQIVLGHSVRRHSLVCQGARLCNRGLLRVEVFGLRVGRVGLLVIAGLLVHRLSEAE